MDIPFTDPWTTLSAWLKDAERTEPRVPDAMQLATVDAEGWPQVRTVLLKDASPAHGLVFYTNLASRKALALEATPRAAVTLHWKVLARQVHAQGPVTPLPAALADAYFQSRPRLSQLGAWASAQSAPIASREALLARVTAATERFEGQPVPRPPHWGGFSIQPRSFEFWSDEDGRLHDRFQCEQREGAWVWSRLMP